MITGNTFNILTVGSNKDNFVNELTKKYSRNIHKFATVNWHIIKESSAKDINRRLQEEEVYLTKKISLIKPHYIVAMQAAKTPKSSELLAKEMSGWLENYKNILFIIGGPFGLSDTILNKADVKLSLSPLTFNHLIIRPMLAEQLYRSLSIIYNTGYHH